MQVSGHSQGAPLEAQYQVQIQAKANASVREQGQQALQLIEEAQPAKASSGHLGTRLHVVG